MHQSRQAAHEQQVRLGAAQQPTLPSTRGRGQRQSWDPALGGDAGATALTAFYSCCILLVSLGEARCPNKPSVQQFSYQPWN